MALELGSRATLERYLGRVARTRAVRPWLRAFFARRLVILFYHAVWRAGDERAHLFGGMELGAFAAQLRLLARDFDFVPLRTLLEEPAEAARPRAVVTFDDGFDLASSGAADALAELGISATQFVTQQCVDYDRLMWQHAIAAIRATRGDERFRAAFNELQQRLGHAPVEHAAEQVVATRRWPMARKDEYLDALWRACEMPPMTELLERTRPYADWDALRAWMARGHGVGSHTRSHPFCSSLGKDEVDAELLEPAAVLRARLGIDWLPFAYPFGDRLAPEAESHVAESRAYSCLLGTGGLSRRGTPPSRIDRVEPEEGMDRVLFGRPLIRALGRLRPA